MVIVAQATDWSEVSHSVAKTGLLVANRTLGGQPTSWNLVAVLGFDWRYVCFTMRGHMIIDPVVTTVDTVPRRKVGLVVIPSGRYYTCNVPRAMTCGHYIVSATIFSTFPATLRSRILRLRGGWWHACHD